MNFFSAKSSGRGEANFMTSATITAGIALIWAGVWAIPSPTLQRIKTVEKVVYKDRPIVKTVNYVAKVRTFTKTVRYSQDGLFDKCMEKVNSNDGSQNNLTYCLDFSKKYQEPRVVVKNVPYRVYGGYKLVYPSRDNRVGWCVDKGQGSVKDCTDWAIRMELPQQVQVKVVHDPYQQLFDKCNTTGSIPSSDPNGTAIRNERLKICADAALRASR
jgi:hypothetical protein